MTMDKDNLGFADDEERKAFYIALPVIALFGGLLYYFLYSPEQSPDTNSTIAAGITIDSDADGIADSIDRCVDEFGSIEHQGCLQAAEKEVETETGADQDTQRQNAQRTVTQTTATAEPLGEVELIEDASLALDSDVPDVDETQTIQRSASEPTPAPEPEPEPAPEPEPEPEPAPVDTDDDGLSDAEDDCPNTAGTVGNNGCPPDTDADGVADAQDKCPDIAGDKDNAGCPAAKVEPTEQEATSITLTPAQSVEESAERLVQDAGFSIQFNEGNAELTGRSKEILLQVANVLERYPDISLEARGYTDSIGSAVVNKALSQSRAQSCIDVIADAGIDRERLTAIGLGEAQPIASNDTAEGRQKNRRVEFKLIR